MNNLRTKLYIKVMPESCEVIFSGIAFAEFIQYLTRSIDNIMIITSGGNIISQDTKFERGLELFEGHELVQKLAKENIYNLGNFCFVDYASSDDPKKLSEEQIAELLYLGHMFKPLRSPFFKELCNNFVYLAHDDGWYCKLFCHNSFDFISVLCDKIKTFISIKTKKALSKIPDTIKNELLDLAVKGLLIDLDDELLKNDQAEIRLYAVGDYSDMDVILNNWDDVKNSASLIKVLCFCDGWIIKA